MLPIFWLLNVAWAMIGFSMKQHASGNDIKLAKRGVVPEFLQNRKNWYSIDIELGTPPQKIPVLLDTASSDFVIVDFDSSYCREYGCEPKHTFYSTKSSSLTLNTTAFIAKYIDCDILMSGTYAQDTVSIQGLKMDHFNFGLATFAGMDLSIGGIGLPSVQYAIDPQTPSLVYDNFPWQLKRKGIIQHVLYSIWLNSVEESAGHILFGGINSKLVESMIFVFPIVESLRNRVDSLAVKLNSVFLLDRLGRQVTIAETALPLILDCGSAVSNLPLSVLQPLYKVLGVQRVGNVYQIPCEYLSHAGGIGLSLSGVEFVFPWRDIAIPLDEDYNDCVPGIWPGDSPRLGANFLRSLYVVYDLEKLEIGIAKARTGALSLINTADFRMIRSQIPGIQAPFYDDSSVHTRVSLNTIKGMLNQAGFIVGDKKEIYNPSSQTNVQYVVGNTITHGLVNYDLWRISLLSETAQTAEYSFPGDRYPQYSYEAITSAD